MTRDADAQLEEGNRRYRQGDPEGAIRCYESALRVEPRHARAHFNLGVVLCALGRLDEAVDHYRLAVEARPDFVGALVNWGNVLKDRGDLSAAAGLYERALSIDAGDAHALNNLAALEAQRGAAAEAQSIYERAIAAGSREACEGLARLHWRAAAALNAEGRHAEATVRYAEAARHAPGHPELLVRWADATLASGDAEAGIAIYRRAIEADPGDPRPFMNLAEALLRRGGLEEARALFSRAAQIRPGWPAPTYNLALLDLREHRFAEGWAGYESRFEADPHIAPPTPCPLPRLPSLEEPGAVVLLKEQGIGDQILFSTLLDEFLEARGDVSLQADPRLANAYRRRFPGLEIVCDPAALRDAVARCAWQLPLGSLPAFLRRTREAFAAQPLAVLAADPERVSSLARGLPAGARIGISWRSFRERLGERKSMPLELFGALAGGGATLVDLQYGDVAGERRAFDLRHPGLRHEVPGLDAFSDLEGVLAAMELCDLVITTSNATAHLSGALGKRTWLVYPGASPPFHYWAPGPDGRSLWYPAVEVVTDPSWTDWKRLMDAVAQRWSGA